MTDKRILKYNKSFVYQGYKTSVGVIKIDLSDINNMKCTIDCDWTNDYAITHLRKALGEVTGIHAGWSFPYVKIETSIFGRWKYKYEFSVQSRLYRNLRRIYES